MKRDVPNYPWLYHILTPFPEKLAKFLLHLHSTVQMSEEFIKGETQVKPTRLAGQDEGAVDVK